MGVEQSPNTAEVQDAAIMDGLPEIVDEKKGADAVPGDENSDDGLFTEDDMPHGVRVAEAMTAVWTKTEIYTLYFFIFLVYFVNSLQSQISNNLIPYVTSDFELHSLTSTITIVAFLVAGVFRLPTAKIIDIWGRAEGYAFMVFLLTIALIMLAACNNVTTYAAAYVFYWVGYDGIMYVLNVVMADTSSLKNRALVYAFALSPYIATTWCGSPAVQSLLGNGTRIWMWRWGYGIFSIVTPIVSFPVWFILWRAQRRAKKTLPGVVKKSGRNFAQNVVYYVIEFDVVGLILICAAWSLILLPFSLESYQGKGWSSTLVIAMWTIGFSCMILFVCWEKWGAPKSFIPFKLLTDRTVLSACLLSMVLFISFYCWDSYFLSFLQVVYGLSVTDAGYVYNIYSIGSCFWAILVGYLIRKTNHFKWIALTASPFMILFSGLMIYARSPDQDVGITIMCQIFIAFAGGTLVICEEMAVMAPSGHTHVAAVLALQAMFTTPGASIGEAISGAIYTTVMPDQLQSRLAAIGKEDLYESIYASLVTQLSYPIGSDVRTAIIDSYGVAQKDMCIAATCIMVLVPFCIIFWRNYNVADMKPTKGAVL